jgi:hypothetical protein
MANIHLGYPNRIDSGTLSGGAWLGGLPLNNLKNKRISKLARSVDTLPASTKFTIAFESAKSIELIALIAHNFSGEAVVRITANSTNNFTSPAFDSGWLPVWPYGFLPQDLLEWEDDNFWLGTISEEAVAGYKTPFSHILSSSVSYQYWQIEISDPDNLDGYVHLGRVFIGPVFVPTINMSWGAGLVVEDATTFETSLAGEEFFDSRERYRIHTFSLDGLTEDEAYQNVLDMQRLLGTSGELFVNGDPDDISNSPRRAFLGRMQSVSPVTHDSFHTYKSSFTIREVL